MAKHILWMASTCLFLMAGAATGQVIRPTPRVAQQRSPVPTQPTARASSQRASLGVAMSDNTRGGVLILRVLPGSAAAAVGLQSGDRIMSIDGKPVSNYRDVARLVSGYHRPRESN